MLFKQMKEWTNWILALLTSRRTAIIAFEEFLSLSAMNRLIGGLFVNWAHDLLAVDKVYTFVY